MDTSSPLSVQPGTYAARFWDNGNVLHGSVDMPANEMVTFEFFDDSRENLDGGFPNDIDFVPEKVQLRNNLDVVLADIKCREWFPGRYIGEARYAPTGLGIGSSREYKQDRLADRSAGHLHWATTHRRI